MDQSSKMKQNWVDASAIAAKLPNCTKFDVFYHALGVLQLDNLVEKAKQGDKAALDVASDLIAKAKARMQSKPTSKPASSYEALKIALWFVEKVGGIEKAKELIAKAEQALKE